MPDWCILTLNTSELTFKYMNPVFLSFLISFNLLTARKRKIQRFLNTVNNSSRTCQCHIFSFSSTYVRILASHLKADNSLQGRGRMLVTVFKQWRQIFLEELEFHTTGTVYWVHHKKFSSVPHSSPHFRLHV